MDTTTGSTPDYGKQQATPRKTGTLGRGRPKLNHNCQETDSSGGPTHTSQTQGNTGLLVIVAANMTDEDKDRAIKDAKEANSEIHIRNSNVEEFRNNV